MKYKTSIKIDLIGFLNREIEELNIQQLKDFEEQINTCNKIKKHIMNFEEVKISKY